MEFKEKLKALRLKRGISQSALAKAIFVSRSAVAKWESGLGLPSDGSLEALSAYFGVDKSYLIEKTDKKERTVLRYTVIFIKAVALFLLFSTSAILCASVLCDSYGVTPELAAGEFRDNPYFEGDGYRIYYSSMMTLISEGEGGEELQREVLSSFRPLRRVPLGWRLFKEDYRYRKLYLAGTDTAVGLIYSIKGNTAYHNIIKISLNKLDEKTLDLLFFDEVYIGGKPHEARESSYFVTDRLPEENITVGSCELSVGEKFYIWEYGRESEAS